MMRKREIKRKGVTFGVDQANTERIINFREKGEKRIGLEEGKRAIKSNQYVM